MKALAKVGNILWLGVHNQKSSALYAYDFDYGTLDLAKSFDRRDFGSLVDASDSMRLVVASSEGLAKFFPPLGRSWTRRFVMSDTYECNQFWPDAINALERRCEAERGIANTVCYDGSRPGAYSSFAGVRTFRCDHVDPEPFVLDFAALHGTWWSSFASIATEGYRGTIRNNVATAQISFDVTGDQIAIEGGICQSSQGCDEHASPYEAYTKASGVNKDNRVWLTHEVVPMMRVVLATISFA